MLRMLDTEATIFNAVLIFNLFENIQQSIDSTISDCVDHEMKPGAVGTSGGVVGLAKQASENEGLGPDGRVCPQACVCSH